MKKKILVLAGLSALAYALHMRAPAADNSDTPAETKEAKVTNGHCQVFNRHFACQRQQGTDGVFYLILDADGKRLYILRTGEDGKDEIIWSRGVINIT